MREGLRRICSAVLGDPAYVKGIHVSGLQKVAGGYYAGGFVGLSDVASTASLSDDHKTGILGLIDSRKYQCAGCI